VVSPALVPKAYGLFPIIEVMNYASILIEPIPVNEYFDIFFTVVNDDDTADTTSSIQFIPCSEV
jgi:hypothetical protein